METQDRTEYAILHPPRIQFRIFDPSLMPANVVTPPSERDIRGCRSEIGLKGERSPCYVRVAGKAERVAAATQPRTARKDERSLHSPARVVEKVQRIQRIQWVQCC